MKGCTGEFPLKGGRVTLARLGETRDGTGFRMLVCPGTGIDTDLFVRGTPLNVKFDAGCEAVRREVMEIGPGSSSRKCTRSLTKWTSLNLR